MTVQMAVLAVQTDPALVQQLERLVTTQVFIALATSILALLALGAAGAALLAVRKLGKSVGRTVDALAPRTDALVDAVTKVAEHAEDMTSSVREQVSEVLQTVEDVNLKLRDGAQAVEDRLKRFGAVVDVVQAETEDLLLDAASTARGVHAAAEQMRTHRGSALPQDAEEDAFVE